MYGLALFSLPSSGTPMSCKMTKMPSPSLISHSLFFSLRFFNPLSLYLCSPPQSSSASFFIHHAETSIFSLQPLILSLENILHLLKLRVVKIQWGHSLQFDKVPYFILGWDNQIINGQCKSNIVYLKHNVQSFNALFPLAESNLLWQQQFQLFYE